MVSRILPTTHGRKRSSSIQRVSWRSISQTDIRPDCPTVLELGSDTLAPELRRLMIASRRGKGVPQYQFQPKQVT
jgi:hypothetical protein